MTLWAHELENMQHYRRADGRLAPHKPLTLLAALGRFHSSGHSRLLWRQDGAFLEALLAKFGAWQPSHMGDPFVRLQTNGTWVVRQESGLPISQSSTDPVFLSQVGAVGELAPELTFALVDDPALHATLVSKFAHTFDTTTVYVRSQ